MAMRSYNQFKSYTPSHYYSLSLIRFPPKPKSITTTIIIHLFHFYKFHSSWKVIYGGGNLKDFLRSLF
ncbi:hypothetical protein HanPSC8_Chr01g0023891 [Helianthus annuus]|nr:hypothetical protein HanPSC8_Chr01g0023891 [Helianthus annuus]